MRKFLSIILISSICCSISYGQNVPNLANESVLSSNSGMSSELSSVPVNIFTGVPQIGVPIYSYSSPRNGLSLNISLDYYAGGVQVAQSAGTVGVGWYLNAGGSIVRTVRGAPDDMPTSGYLYAAAIPTDYRSNGDKYFFDSLDAQQDIFQFNFNGRSGKFFMGKNGQIVVVPNSKLKVIPTFGAGGLAQRIVAFRIITEDGTKYDFNNAESATITTQAADSTLFRSAYSGKAYFSSWYLGQIIAPFNTDTIKINYTTQANNYSFAYPEMTFVKNPDTTRIKTIMPAGLNSSTDLRISSVIFPEKTSISFTYNLSNLVTKIKISDSIFRSGFLLNYLTNYYDPYSHSNIAIRPQLTSVVPYTATRRNFGYSFSYYGFLGSSIVNGLIEKSSDYWGFFNDASEIPRSNNFPSVNGYPWSSDRNPDSASAINSSLQSVTLPTGGTITYDYELNDHYPYIKTPYNVSISPTTAYSGTISLNQVFNTKQQLTFILDSTVSRTGSIPVSGTGNLIVYIKNTAGTLTYATDTISLYNLFYEGIATFSFNVPNGSYQLNIPAVTGTTITGSFPVNIKWENKTYDNTHISNFAGGIRVKKITKRDGPIDPNPVIEQYKYINTDGTSSGFLGDLPSYFYYYLESVNFGGLTTTSYTVVSGEPVNTMDYAQGSPVGYSRVEVYKGTTTHNLGKTVYEFTNLQDVNSGVFTEAFPYVPQDLRDYGIGLPKKVSVYDSTGSLIKRTVNNYVFDSSFYRNSNFKSLKLGNTYTYVNGDPNNTATPRTRTYIGQEYYPVTGHAYLASSYDTLFQPNGSQNTSYVNYYYDTNYNVIKSVRSYDRTRGLQLENRLYYPYNYTISGPIKTFRDSSIITPVISSESWITGDANPRIIAGSITDYQSTAGYLKPLATYALQSNAPVSQSTIGTFNPAVLNRNTTYFVKQANFVSYDNKGNLQQAQNALSGINNSVIMDYNKQFPVAKVSNAAYNDIAYTSFESDGTGNWTITGTARDSLNAMTGKKSYNLSSGNITKSGLTSTTYYLLTVWAKSGTTVNVNSSPLSTVIASQQGWNFYSTTLSGITSVTVSGSGSIDELRLHPKDANMVTTTYEPMVGVTSTTDANNTITYNEYDNLNRIKLVRDKDKNILKKYDYSDSNMVISQGPIWTLVNYQCDGLVDGLVDSTFQDTNIYSDTYNSSFTNHGTDYCRCYVPVAHPDYQLISSICTVADQICYTYSAYIKIINPDNTYYWTWKSVYHYHWIANNSNSADFTEYNPSHGHSLGCSTYIPF
ncbi:hypothetical protein FW778_08555 [Ginsengibacter hankyongi]|uniref:YD repeat-containing protein n=1 Tax=Ginsengibacter hankyongi TaxID=2607284 RepID=A0A5J5IR62_9BACT|nr:hypothetical protein [Ginsengibacter hankyongi]KAA9042052.1 hypothetical protein FW778_08555 [Ginsengibacter hankyongi]